MPLPSFSTLLVSVRDRVCWVELNRPARKNAFSSQMYEDVIAAFEWAAQSEEVHVLVLTGSPLSKPVPFYSSGNDLKNLTDVAAGNGRGEVDVAAMAHAAVEMMVRFVDAFIDFPKALITAINGPAHGIAVTTAMLADLVYASDRASFTTPFTKLGQNPEGCSSLLLPILLGHKANRLLLLGETLSAQDADRHNLISQVFPHESFREEVHARAVKLANFPLHSVMASKQLVRRQTQAALKAANRDEARVLEQLLLDPRTFEAVMAQMAQMAAKPKKAKL